MKIFIIELLRITVNYFNYHISIDESQIDGARVKISDDGDDNDDDVVIMDEFKAEEMDQEESEINAYDVLTLVYGEESDVPLLRSDHEDVPPTKKETSPTPPSPKRILFEQTANKRRKVILNFPKLGFPNFVMPLVYLFPCPRTILTTKSYLYRLTLPLQSRSRIPN